MCSNFNFVAKVTRDFCVAFSAPKKVRTQKRCPVLSTLRMEVSLQMDNVCFSLVYISCSLLASSQGKIRKRMMLILTVAHPHLLNKFM